MQGVFNLTFETWFNEQINVSAVVCSWHELKENWFMKSDVWWTCPIILFALTIHFSYNRQQAHINICLHPINNWCIEPSSTFFFLQLIATLNTHIVLTDAWLEIDFCVSCASYIFMLLAVDNGPVFAWKIDCALISHLYSEHVSIVGNTVFLCCAFLFC